MRKLLSSTNLRTNLFDVLDAIDSKNEEYFLVTKNGRPVSALVNLDYFEDLLALKSTKYLDSIKEARENFKKGEVYDFEDIFGEL